MGHRARPLRPSNLPAELTSFVGRRTELREVKQLLATTRLLTLTGSGGAGKTRLALRAAAEMARGFPDGAWLASLAPIQDPLLVTQAVFGALGVHDLSAGPSLSSLTEYLAGRRLLLVLDNCEHLLDASAVLAGTLLKACPDLHLLATSRQALGVTGEIRMIVPPMSLPEEGNEVSVQRLIDSDAVRLLSERAAAVVPGFAVDVGNAAAVLDLCRRLDGVPLALELAAVRLGSLSLDQLNRGLDRELSILGSGNRDAEARQQTLEAAIGWSYGLLSEQERLLWARLSVFTGGFEEDAAAEVCSDPQLPPEQIAGLLGALVEKSILKRQLRNGGVSRYWLLETLRQYGQARLRELGEETVTHKRHFDWIRGLAEVIGVWDSRQAEMFRRMSEEQDNLWAALDFCLRQPGEVEAAAELAQHLMAYWSSRGPYGDVRRVLMSLAESAPQNSVSRARLLWVAAEMATTQNDYDACAALSEESLRIGTEVRDVEVVAWSLIMEGSPRWLDGDLPAATERFELALSLAGLMRLEQAELHATNALCGVYVARGALERAIDVGEQGLAMSKDRGELWLRGYLLNFLAQANWLRGDKRRGEALAREAAGCEHALDDRIGLTMVLETLASMAAELGQHQRAACLLGVCERVRDESSLTLIELFHPQHDRSASIIVQGIGQKSFDAVFARGRAMTVGEGVAFAIEDKQPPKSAPVVKPEPRAVLTGRQLDIARLVADDLSNSQIAARLFLSERTVETHITNIFNKLGLNSRTQLSRWVADAAGQG
ncbi:MAG TPA: LuxR C-terminal-related transcriptional regulator [Streptosporangiaceae bacterium]|nr:LuxR C-terminal-related transcriptional regulator [Streptosporangiaceae bacterium]